MDILHSTELETGKNEVGTLLQPLHALTKFFLAEIEASTVVRGQIPDAFIFVKERHLTPEVLFTVSEEIERAALIS